MVKPAKGFKGAGVTTFTPWFYPRLLKDYLYLKKRGEHISSDGAKRKLSLERMVENKEYEYEEALGIVQPMIGKDKEEYSAVRSIVCNGEYVDSYERVSDKAVVNFANGAEAREFEEPKGFETFCENAVSDLENSIKKYSDNFKEEIYKEYLDSL